MTSSDIAVRRQASAIPAKLQYAHELAASGLLPAQYRRNPANVLWAVEYGEMLGLSPMAAITGVHVIEGKPSASAGLISGLVRKAGHKLRVWGTNNSATCEIVRSDDPEHTFSVTWTLKKESGDNPSAEVAGLLGKNTWKNYPAAMLKSRAITQCARDACEEVLFGLHYTPEELGAEVDEDGIVVAGIASEPALTPEQEWLAAALTAAPGHASLDACGAVWARVVEYVNDGKLTKAEGGRLQDALRVRIDELKVAPAAPEAEATPADALDPEDPWAVAISELIDSGAAESLLADAADQAERGEIAEGRHALIMQAVEDLFPGITTEAEAA